jgi:hypothetical protein
VSRLSSPTWATLLIFAACKTGPSDLGIDPGGGGSGGASTTATTTGGRGGEGGTGAGVVIVEPDLPARLTIVHGSPDRGEIQLCFASASGDSGLLPEAPLGFAESLALADPASVLDVASELEILVFAGDLDGLSGACGDLADDPPPGLDVASLGVVPAGTFSEPRSLALVVTGCFGPAEAEGAEDGCGPGYGAETPTLYPVLAPLSRYPNAAVGFSVLHATSTFEPLDVEIRPSQKNALPFPIVEDLPRGASLPFPPNTSFSKASLGAPSGAAAITRVSGAPMLVETNLGAAFSNGGLSSPDNGSNYVLVAVGASPFAPEGFWEPFTYVVVEANPE